MSPVTLVHPDSEQLAAFATGHASAEIAAEISAHLGECELCRTVVESLPNDTLLSLLKKPLPTTGLPETVAGPTAATTCEIPTDLAAHPRYHVLELLGAGGMGAVYKAEHRLMERHVALKVMNPKLLNRSGSVERFQREVKAAAKLNHSNIVTAYDADQAGDTHFLVMEYVEGVSLAQRVYEHGSLPVLEACDYIYQAALGLQHAFECGMVHRDIKPHNLMLTSAAQVKILDFGLARFVRESASADTQPDPSPLASHPSPLTEAGVVMGTADFIAPEQANDPGEADIRADIYSLGCTLYYLLTGHGPFPGGTALDKLKWHKERAPAPLAKLRSDLPSGLTQVLDRMMAKDPAQRYQKPAEVAKALAPFAGKAFWTRTRIRRSLVAAALLAAAIVAGVIIYIQTDNGEFVIEAESDKVAVMVNGKGVKIRDESTKREYLLKIGRHHLRPGEYRIDVQELPAGVEFATDHFTLRRGDSTAVSVTFNAKKDPGYLKDDALRWFPADATYFQAINMTTFPEFSRLQHLLAGEVQGDRFRKFGDLMGPLDRHAIAYVENRQHPDQSRSFVRLSGSIKRNRLVDFFRQEFPGVTIEQMESKGEQITLIYDAKSDKGILGGAVALIGTTDVLIGGYFGPSKNHLEVLRQSLERRAGQGASLCVAQAKALQEIPDNVWGLAIGEPPPFFKKNFLFAFMRSARSFAMSMSGTNDIEVRYRGSFSSEGDAKLFMTMLSLMENVFTKAPMVSNNPELSAGVAKAISDVQKERDGDRVTVHIRIPSVAWAALLEKMHDTPLRELMGTPAFDPGTQK
jgi:tRNA A-37 threonylcarbamoyl transferase component Bud32